jgi:signal peptidase I
MNPQKPISDIKRPTPQASDFGGLYNNLPLPSQAPSVAPIAAAANPAPVTPVTPVASAISATPIAPIAPSPVAPVSQIPNKPLKATPIETPKPTAKNRTPWLRDVIGLGVFVAIIFVGAMLINSFIFRSFDVIGPSMEPTLAGGLEGSMNEPSDRVIVNLVPVTLSHIGGKDWVPSRGNIIVFKNPMWNAAQKDEYVVKRVVGLPGERVTVNNCELKVYNKEHSDGFNPYPEFKNFADNDKEINTCIDGDGTDVTVPNDAIFVVGDHRVNNYSMDSRNGGGRASLGTIPLNDIIGPVSLRIWPLNQLKMF